MHTDTQTYTHKTMNTHTNNNLHTHTQKHTLKQTHKNKPTHSQTFADKHIKLTAKHAHGISSVFDLENYAPLS